MIYNLWKVFKICVAIEQPLVDMMRHKTNLEDCIILPFLRVGRIDVSKDR